MPVTNAQDMAKAGSLINSDGTTVSVAADLLIADKLVHTGDTNTAIRFPAADTVTVETSGTERMRIDSSGNVGIGTTSPHSPATANPSLDIAGGANKSANIFLHGNNTSGGSGGLQIQSGSDASAYIYNNSNVPLVFGTNGTERLRITSGGEVCVGRTSSGAKLHIYNSGSTDARTAYFEKATGATDGYYIVCYAGETSHFLILGNGNCQNANNSYSGISDIKLKQDITDASSQWSDIKNLRVRKYRFKEYPEMPLQIGLVAQEVELVSPQLVEETKDTDREGNDLGTITKGVKYSVLYMKAVKALQEAMDRIEQLESKVAALEAA